MRLSSRLFNSIYDQYDLLAHLAERMIEMNKKKNAEIKGFLRWLEGEIEIFAGALAKNKKKLKEGYGLTEDEIKIVEESISGGKNAKETRING